MKGVLMMLLVAGVLALSGCGTAPAGEANTAGAGTYRTITPAEARARLAADPTIKLVDVRTPAEYQEKHIPGSILIPDTELAARAPALLPSKTATVIVYCRTGRRSREAALTLLGMGYTNVFDLTGGITAWPYETVGGA